MREDPQDMVVLKQEQPLAAQHCMCHRRSNSHRLPSSLTAQPLASAAGHPGVPRRTTQLMDLVGATPPRRSETVWFADGNLILRAEDVVFRVYRGVLQSKSTVFADMLAMPQPDSMDMLDGCPAVVLHGDSAVDAERFLGVLYDGECVSNLSRRTFAVLTPPRLKPVII
jgi:hypothetical protein